MPAMISRGQSHQSTPFESGPGLSRAECEGRGNSKRRPDDRAAVFVSP
jgi:hypothetical protein